MIEVDIRHRQGAFALEAAFTAPQGLTALVGRSGAGKTTLVNAVAGLLRPDAGRVVVDGAVLMDSAAGIWVPPHRRRVGYVFQDARLFPHLSVRGNLGYGARLSGGIDAGEVARIADLLGIAALLDRRPGALSGGETQRVAIGRALLSRPRLLLMDEPLAALDEARKAEILPYVERLRDALGLPVLYVSHALPEVARLATTVVALSGGRVAQAGPAAEVLSDPEAVPALGLREAGALLTGTIAAHEADGLTRIARPGGDILLPRLPGAPGAPVRMRIAAQDVMLALERPARISALNVLPATVTAVKEGQGPGVIVQLANGEERLLARITRRSAQAMEIREGLALYAIVKSVSVAQGDATAG